MNYWLFTCNPKRYPVVFHDLEMNSINRWMVGVHKNEIGIGDKVAFWIGGNSDPGIYMFAEIAGVTVNAVCPGFMDTPMLQASIDNIVSSTGRTPEQAAQALRSFNPQRRFIKTAAVARAVCWLASPEASDMNGHALALSGGEV